LSNNIVLKTGETKRVLSCLSIESDFYLSKINAAYASYILSYYAYASSEKGNIVSRRISGKEIYRLKGGHEASDSLD